MKKATIRNISAFLNRALRVRKIHDASVNGLQVTDGQDTPVPVTLAAPGRVSVTVKDGDDRALDALVQMREREGAASTTGIAAATGEIVAFTDSDCRADEDWLYYLVQDLLRGNFAGIGGHNFLPPEDSCVAAAVVVSQV